MLALVGSYLMMPPTKCCSSRAGDPDYDFLCGATLQGGSTAVITKRCGADVNAPLDEWILKGSYDTVRECTKALPGFSTKDALGNDVASRCIATDDPRLKEK